MTIEESGCEVGLFVTWARYLGRGASISCLATLKQLTESLYVSLIAVATDLGGSPIFSHPGFGLAHPDFGG
jgi:hypothetical protein